MSRSVLAAAAKHGGAASWKEAETALYLCPLASSGWVG